MCRNLVEAVVLPFSPRLDGQVLLCLVEVGKHLRVDGFDTAAGRHGIDISLQLHGHTACGGWLAVGVGFGIEIDEQEVAVGSEHVTLAHELRDFVACGIGDFALVGDDVVGDVDGMVVAAPGEVTRGGRRGLVFPPPEVKVGIKVGGGGLLLVHQEFVGAQGGHVAVLGEILVLVGEQGTVFLASLGNDLASGGDVEEVVAGGEREGCQQDGCHRHACCL